MLNKVRARRPLDLPVEKWTRTAPIRLLLVGLATLLLLPVLASLLAATLGPATAGPVLVALIVIIPVLALLMRGLGGTAMGRATRTFLVVAVVLGVAVYGAIRGGVAALPLVGLVTGAGALLVAGLASK